MNQPFISRRDWILATLVAIVVPLFMLLPYWVGYLATPPELHYTGLVMNAEDSQTYFAKMRQGFEGKWLYTISFTAEPHEPEFVGVFYLTLGQVARFLNITITQIWHGARFIAGVVLFFTCFWVITQFVTNRRTVWTAYLLAVFGSGQGWMLFSLGQVFWLGFQPVDFKMPGSHLFFMALTFPHITLSTAFILIVVWLFYQMVEGERLRLWYYAIFAGILNLFIGIAFPFLVYLLAGIVSIYYLGVVWKARKILWSAGVAITISFVIPLPLYLYYAYTVNTNEIFALWGVQADTLSPPIPHYLVAYGLMLLVAGWVFYRQRRYWLWVAWIMATALLVYAPMLNMQRRFVQGLQVPLSILTAIGMVEIVLPALLQTRLMQRLLQSPRYTPNKLSKFLLTTFVLFMGMSNIYLYADVFRTAVIGSTLQDPPIPFFRTQAEVAGIAWLADNTEDQDVVLGAYQVGNYVAAHAGNQVVLGHWAETAYFEQREKEVFSFYQPATSDQWRHDFIEQFHIRYVWFSPQEEEMLKGKGLSPILFDPTTVDWLVPVFRQDGVVIYAVTDSRL